VSESPTSDVYPYGERRLGLRILRYWQEKRGMRMMPSENDMDPEALGDDWDYCFLLQARDVANIQDYNFTYLGQRIMNAYFDKAIDEHNQLMVGPMPTGFRSISTRCSKPKPPCSMKGNLRLCRHAACSTGRYCCP